MPSFSLFVSRSFVRSSLLSRHHRGGGGGQGQGSVVAGRLLDDRPHGVVGLVLSVLCCGRDVVCVFSWVGEQGGEGRKGKGGAGGMDAGVPDGPPHHPHPPHTRHDKTSPNQQTQSRALYSTDLDAELAACLDDGGLDAPQVLVVDAGEEVVLSWGFVMCCLWVCLVGLVVVVGLSQQKGRGGWAHPRAVVGG